MPVRLTEKLPFLRFFILLNIINILCQNWRGDLSRTVCRVTPVSDCGGGTGNLARMSLAAFSRIPADWLSVAGEPLYYITMVLWHSNPWDDSKDSAEPEKSPGQNKLLVHFTSWGEGLAAKNRAATLFDSAQIGDPYDPEEKWGFFGHFRSKRQSSAPFKLVTSEFLQRAKANPPRIPESTASAFSQWVYSLYGSGLGTDEDRERGKEMERRLLEARRKAACSTDDTFLRSIGSSWVLAHNGLNQQDGSNVFQINDLYVNGRPLRASPDLLYHNECRSEVIVVEIKHSRRPIPANLWPNVWAQLWCYSQIEIARAAQKVTVVGEVWGETWTKARGRGLKRVEGQPEPFLRASVRRDPRVSAYDRFFRQLFDIYRGNR